MATNQEHTSSNHQMKKGDIVEGGEKSKTDCDITETSSANKDAIAP